MRPRKIALLALLGAAVAIGVAVVVSSDNDHEYIVHVQLDNAGGLRKGRPVRVGGADVGKVKDLRLDRADHVVADLAIDPAKAKIGRGASASIRATNLLAERYVDLNAGDLRHPQPSGAVIPRTRTSRSVDLDQVVDVLNADTRTRLAIMINEAGIAFTGRHADFNRLLQEIPPGLDDANNLVNQLVTDNRTLGHLIERADSFISRLTPARRHLARMVKSAGESMRTFSARRADLRDTLERAPGALSTLRRFLSELRRTTVPLRPAARVLARTAPLVTTTLSELDPFRRAAQPALEQAKAVAPQLTRLGIHATPVLRRSNPTLRALVGFAGNVQPLTHMLVHGSGVNTRHPWQAAPFDDLLNDTHTWARSIQERDGVSHIFRGYVDFNLTSLQQLLTRYSKAPSKHASGRGQRPAHAPGGSGSRVTRPPAAALAPAIDRVARELLGGITGKLPLPHGDAPKPNVDPPLPRLLDYLLKP